MEKKVIKFRDKLARLILAGEKNTTWRLFDDKNLSEGDSVGLVNWDTGEKFGEAVLTKVWEKKMSTLDDSDFDGHERFGDQEEMYKTYRMYYGDRVGLDTTVKIIRFQLQ